MLKDHKLFKVLTRCTGVEYDHNHTNKIQASSTWWEHKIKENPKYKQFMDRDCSEYYTTYARLFGDTCDSMQYALTPTKLGRCGFDLGRDTDTESPKDIDHRHEEGTDSSDGPTTGKVQSSMHVSGVRSGDKWKGRASKGKGKGKEKRKNMV